MAYTVAVDIGGTFTDLVAVDVDTGDVVTVKEPSVPKNFVEGVTAALRTAGVERLGEFRHATTVGTNAIIERTGARTALLTTFGFRDVLLAGRANKPDLYDSHWDPPPPLVPRPLIRGIRERVAFDGEVVVPLHEDDVAEAVALLKERGVESVAIAFLNAFMNPAHELRTKELVEAALPGVFVCTSSEVLPEIREFERTSTTVANAYLGPKMSVYLNGLDRSLRESGGDAQLDGELLISHSGGGLMSVSSATELPARICQSGPAAGVMGARAIAAGLGFQNGISLDMGGTSADIATIVGGEPIYRSEWHIEFNIPIIFPAVDLVTIGAGGGTIAWIDETGTLHAGPQSAGADPGPVAYGRGGTQPTNTDANVLLGRLPVEAFLGGRMTLDRDAAEKAIAEQIAAPLGMGVDEAAAGMLRLSNSAMLNAIRLMTTQRGYDPREFSLIAFGGAGALHAADLARDAGIKRIVVPRLPGLMSARGILYIDARHDLLEPLFQRGSSIDESRVARAVASLEERAATLKERDRSITDWRTEWSADLRYYGQISGYMTLQLPPGDPAAGLHALVDRFTDEHEREFGYRLPPELAEVEIVNLRAAVVGVTAKPPETPYRPEAASNGTRKTGDVYFFEERGRVETVYVARDSLAVGDELEGPAIVTEWDSTTVVPPRSKLVVAETGDLVITFTD
jgi:N-methylhydantoinase A